MKQLRSQALTETTQRDMKSLSENFSQVEKKLSWRTVWEVWTQEFLVLYWKAWFNPRLTKIPLSKGYFCLVGQVTELHRSNVKVLCHKFPDFLFWEVRTQAFQTKQELIWTKPGTIEEDRTGSVQVKEVPSQNDHLVTVWIMSQFTTAQMKCSGIPTEVWMPSYPTHTLGHCQ